MRTLPLRASLRRRHSVQVEGIRGRAEGLVHVSLIQSAMLRSPHDAVKRGQRCYVKVLSATGTKLSLSMKDADQKTGEDLSPNMRLPGQSEAPGGSTSSSNPTRELSRAEVEERRLKEEEEDARARRPLKRLTSPELFEAKQLIASGVLDVRDYPQFDEQQGLLGQTETEEELEIELNESVRPLSLILSSILLSISLSISLSIVLHPLFHLAPLSAAK